METGKSIRCICDIMLAMAPAPRGQHYINKLGAVRRAVFRKTIPKWRGYVCCPRRRTIRYTTPPDPLANKSARKRCCAPFPVRTPTDQICAYYVLLRRPMLGCSCRCFAKQERPDNPKPKCINGHTETLEMTSLNPMNMYQSTPQPNP